MSKKKNAASDPMRRLALLWGSQTEAGRSGLTVKAIVTAGISLADQEGLEALSMRNVADRLNVGTMSLYTHVPGKGELIDLMFDTVLGELYTRIEDPAEQPGDWRDAMRFVAEHNWNLYMAHPWLLEIPPGRPVLGPRVSFKYEAELRPLDGLGLGDVEIDAALTLILTHVEGCARAYVGVMRTQEDTGVTDAEWWVTQAPLLEKIIDPTLFPLAGRVGSAAGEAYQAASNPQFVFTFGLERILAGIADLIRDKNGG